MDQIFTIKHFIVLLLAAAIHGQSDTTSRNCVRNKSQYMIGYDDLICRCNEVPQSVSLMKTNIFILAITWNFCFYLKENRL